VSGAAPPVEDGPSTEDKPAAVLVRHAQTQWSLDGRHTGSTDIPLTEHGRELARRLEPRLARWRFAAVFVSPLGRARETCELSGLGREARVLDDLHEWDYGEYEGLTTAEIRRVRPDWVLWRDGCPGGELPRQVGARADRVLAAVAQAGAPVALFSHGHMLRVIGARWIAQEAAQGGRLGLSAGALCVLGHERETAVIARWNDTGTDGDEGA
jgi:probable phosphoglycerate mutase